MAAIPKRGPTSRSVTKMQAYSPQTRNEARVHRLPIIVGTFTVLQAISGVGPHCKDSVMSNRSLSERNFVLLCWRYVTSFTEEPDICFRNAAFFLCAWKPMSGRDLARFVDKPRWFEFRVGTLFLSNTWSAHGGKTRKHEKGPGTTKPRENTVKSLITWRILEQKDV